MRISDWSSDVCSSDLVSAVQPTWLGTSRRTIHESPASGCSTGSPIGGGGSAPRACERHCVDRHGNGRDWRGGCSAACVRQNRRARRTSPYYAIGPRSTPFGRTPRTFPPPALGTQTSTPWGVQTEAAYHGNTVSTNVHIN